MIELEDGVALSAKAEARVNARAALDKLSGEGTGTTHEAFTLDHPGSIIDCGVEVSC